MTVDHPLLWIGRRRSRSREEKICFFSVTLSWSGGDGREKGIKTVTLTQKTGDGGVWWWSESSLSLLLPVLLTTKTLLVAEVRSLILRERETTHLSQVETYNYSFFLIFCKRRTPTHKIFAKSTLSHGVSREKPVNKSATILLNCWW